MNDQTQRYPYGVDPTLYSLNRLQYDAAIRDAQEREHWHRIDEQQNYEAIERRLNEEQRETARQQKAAAEAVDYSRRWWLQPAKAAGAVASGAFWCGIGFACVMVILSSWIENDRRASAKWCFADMTRCQEYGGVKVEKSWPQPSEVR